MQRRAFLQWSAVAPAAFATVTSDIPKYRTVSKYQPHPYKGFPASVVSVHSAKSIDEATEKVDPQTVRQMIERGMTALTGESTPAAAWKRFFSEAMGSSLRDSLRFRILQMSSWAWAAFEAEIRWKTAKEGPFLIDSGALIGHH